MNESGLENMENNYISRLDYLNRILFTAVGSFLPGVILVFTLLGIYHLLFFNGRDSLIMSVTAFFSAVLFMIFKILHKKKKLYIPRAHLYAFLIFITVLVNSLLYMIITSDILQSTYIIILLLVLPIIQPARKWYISSVVITITVWSLLISVVPGYDYKSASLIHFILSVSFSILLSVIIHFVLTRFIDSQYSSELEQDKNNDALTRALQKADYNEKILKRLTELAVEGIGFHDGEKIVNCNEQFSRMFGYPSKTEISGQDILSLIAPESQETVIKKIVNSIAGSYEVQGIRRDGRKFPMELNAKTIIKEDNDMLRAVIVHDLTEQKLIQEKLRESEEMFRTMSEYSPVGIFLSDINGDCVFVNDKYLEITGLNSQQALGNTWKSIIYPTDKARVYKQWDDFVRSNENFHTMYRIKSGIGNIRWIDVRISVYKADDKILGYVGTVEDFTEYRKQEEELIEYSRNLGEMVELRTRELESLQDELITQQLFQKELEIASEIQMSLLPTKAPVIDGFQIASIAIPAQYVSGDFYNCYNITDEILEIGIADIAGKGVAAALLAAGTRAFLRASVSEENLPDKSLAFLNSSMYDDLNNAEKFITMQMTRIDGGSGRISYTSAGHTESLLYLSRKNKVARLLPTTIPIGIVEDLVTDIKEFYMLPGDLLFLYSDGVTEAEDANQELFGIERLKASIQSCCEQNMDAPTVIATLYSELNDFMKAENPNDDITMVAIRAEEQEFSIEKPGDFEHLDSLVTWVGDKCRRYGEELRNGIELAASELITNMIKHSYGKGSDGKNDGLISIKIELNYNYIELNLYDFGSPFEISSVAVPDFASPNESGYGIWMINQIMDYVEYRAGGEDKPENHWILRKNIS